MSNYENFTEDKLEEAAIEILQELDYEHIFAPEISFDGERPERKNYKDVLLERRIKDALFRINRDLPQEALDEAYRKIISFHSPILEENNRYFHQLLVEGIEVSFREDGIDRTKKAVLVDFERPERNDFLVVNQFTIVEHEERRPDLIIFINGIPLVVIELKSASDENVGIDNAYEQIQTYKRDNPTLFNYNAFCILSDGINAKAGTITANQERFMNWRTIDGVNIESLDVPQYEVMLRGMLGKERILDIIQNFILFQETKEDEKDESGKNLGDKKSIAKILAAYHQYFAVKKAVDKTKEATSESGDRKIGVVWHTQGSGKSFSMVFYTAQLVKQLNNPTIVVITDRNDLDDQLYQTFWKSRDVLRQTPKQAHVRRLTEEQKNNKQRKIQKNLMGYMIY